MGKTPRTDIITEIRELVAGFIIGADPSELQAGDTAAAVYAYTHQALHTERLHEFGTPEWVVLADDDPRKTHAVTLAALAYLNQQAATAAAHVQTSEDVRNGMREHGVTVGPGHAEIVRRRTVALDAAPADTAAQIMAKARYSWASFERQLARDTHTDTHIAATPTNDSHRAA